MHELQISVLRGIVCCWKISCVSFMRVWWIHQGMEESDEIKLIFIWIQKTFSLANHNNSPSFLTKRKQLSPTQKQNCSIKVSNLHPLHLNKMKLYKIMNFYASLRNLFAPRSIHKLIYGFWQVVRWIVSLFESSYMSFRMLLLFLPCSTMM